MELQNLSLNYEEDPEIKDALIVKFKGFLDKSTISLAEEEIVKKVGSSTEKYLIFDLAGLSYINSEGIGFLMMVSTSLSDRGRKLFIINSNPQVSDIFETIGLPKMVDCFDSLRTCNDHISKL